MVLRPCKSGGQAPPAFPLIGRPQAGTLQGPSGGGLGKASQSLGLSFHAFTVVCYGGL